MFTHFTTGRGTLARRFPAFVLAALALLIASAQVNAQATCQPVNGHFTLIPLSGPTCTSPLGACATGLLNGGLQGDFLFAFTSIVPAADTPATGVAVFTGMATVSPAQVGAWQGTLRFTEAGVFDTAGVNGFSEMITITGGTGSFVNATGTIFADGSFNPATGGAADYHGKVCVP